METRVSVAGTVIAFVVAADEDRPEDGTEFGSAQAALDSNIGGTFFKKIRRQSGSVSYDPGIHPDMRVGMEMYGRGCSGCGTMLWSERIYTGRALCGECSEAHQGHDDFDDIEQFDREY